jgi:hypothetical protein
MRFGRPDYDAIQPWPQHRPHIVKHEDGSLGVIAGTHDRTTDEALERGSIRPVIAADEPVFLLRSRDAAAPGIVDAYADLIERMGASPDTVASVREQAARMVLYAVEHGAKVPDLPTRVPAYPPKSPTEHRDRLT